MSDQYTFIEKWMQSMEISDKTFRKSCYHICNKISPLKFESVKKKKWCYFKAGNNQNIDEVFYINIYFNNEKADRPKKLV